MGLSRTTNDSISSRSTVFETGSKFAHEVTTGTIHEDSLPQLDGEQKCYGPWDDWNLFDRLTNSDINHEYVMDEYVNYLTSLLKNFPGVYKPTNRPIGLRLSAYEDKNETDRCESSCPSLTDDSTLSGTSFFAESRKSPVRYSPKRRESLFPLKSNLLPTLNKNKRYGGFKDLRTTLLQLPHVELGYSLDSRPKFESWSNTRKSFRPVVIKTSAPPKIRADIQTRCYEASDSDSLDSETSTDISSDDEEYDPFEKLNNAIRRVFSFNEQLADKVINYLVRLPLHRRAKVYGYGAISSYGADDSQESSIIVNYGDNFRPTKRKRVDDTSPDNLRPNQTLEGDDHDDRVLVDHQRREKDLALRRFACGYNLFDRAIYSPMNTRGRTATRYKSCAGPGFLSLNHYKRHLERVHTLHQCSRCGDIFDTSGELQSHLAQDSRCIKLTFEHERGISQATWDKVKGILKRKRKAQDEPSDEERWFRVWDVLFPEMHRPPTAYFEEPQMHSTYPARALEVFDFLLTNQPELASVRSHRDDILKALRHALDVAGQGTQLNQEVGDQVMISPQPPPSSQDPLLNSNAQHRSLDTYQIAISEPHIPDEINEFTGLSNPLEEMGYPDDVPIDNVALYGVSSSIYPEVGVTADEYDDGPYGNPLNLGNLSLPW
ncbi:uncharacterized protein F4812DRAFT_303280 [Daldinia caldariorum]|uniref:uncharacterized protein n=1 Tax=Daldinia caldariorum TaxID=326644 RepID=UPI002008D693|nr:uncharacterized protein F4812DRAFT_303280 [Daldinia caldariorum]KAI1469791.1 hypothetical protein F4812DRAFT_303280 [Daldinia caldariorum]